jgi:hypothetical protein
MACAACSLSTLAPMTKYSVSPSWEVPPRLLAYVMESDETARVVVVVGAVLEDVTPAVGAGPAVVAVVEVKLLAVDNDEAEEGTGCCCAHPETAATTASPASRTSRTAHGLGTDIPVLILCPLHQPIQTSPRRRRAQHGDSSTNERLLMQTALA